MTSYVGVDACKGGWVAVVIHDAGFVDAFIGASIQEVESHAIERFDAAALVVDIPIGIPDFGDREADLLARKFVGANYRSAFPTPLRWALSMPTHELAAAENRRFHQRQAGISVQTYGIVPKILEVDAFLGQATVAVLEGHPEVSFREMRGAALEDLKKSFAGMLLRRDLLAREGIEIPMGVEKLLRRTTLDDVLDAAAMAWTARRIARGEAMSLPAQPEFFSDGWPSSIWY